jgi:hypothetical protein
VRLDLARLVAHRLDRSRGGLGLFATHDLGRGFDTRSALVLDLANDRFFLLLFELGREPGSEPARVLGQLDAIADLRRDLGGVVRVRISVSGIRLEFGLAAA